MHGLFLGVLCKAQLEAQRPLEEQVKQKYKDLIELRAEYDALVKEKETVDNKLAQTKETPVNKRPKGCGCAIM